MGKSPLLWFCDRNIRIHNSFSDMNNGQIFRGWVSPTTNVYQEKQKCNTCATMSMSIIRMKSLQNTTQHSRRQRIYFNHLTQNL